MLRSFSGLFGFVLAAGLASSAIAQSPPASLGQQVYERACASCHAAPPPGSRASSVDLLRKMSASTLKTALTSGPMRGIGESLSPEEFEGVVSYLAAKTDLGAGGMPAPPMCQKDQLEIKIPTGTAPKGWGFKADNSRQLSAAESGLTSKDLDNLEVAWTLAFPGTTTLRSQGVVAGSTLFYAAGQAGRLYALDTATGCAKWIAQTPSEIRTGLSFGKLSKSGRFALVGSDGGGQVQVWDALTGKLIWRVDPRTAGLGMLTGTPAFAGDKLIVPISAIDVALAMRPSYGCCKGHGAVAALKAETGERLWTYHTMVDAAPLGVKNSQGVEMQGPSGAPIWSSPAIDMAHGVVYVGTGENTSPPATGTSDSIVAIDLSTGRAKWVFQALKNAQRHRIWREGGFKSDSDQHHVGLTWVGHEPWQGLKGLKEPFTLSHDLCGLCLKHGSVLQSEGCTSGVQNTHVVRGSDLVELLHPRGLGDQVPQARASQAKFRKRAHQNHLGIGLRVFAHAGQPGVTRKRRVSFIQHHHPAIGADLGNDLLKGQGAP